MKKKLKRLIIVIGLISVSLINTEYLSANSIENKDEFKLKVNNDSFTEFSDVLIPEDQKYFLELNKIYFDNIDLNKLKLKNYDIVSSKKLLEIKKDLLRDANLKAIEEHNKREEFAEQKRIVDVNLSDERQMQNVNNSVKPSASAKANSPSSDKSTSLNGNNPWKLAEVAAGYEKEDKLNNAIICYQNAIKAYPDRIEILYSYSLCLYKIKQYSNAEIILKKIISVDPNFTLAYYNLGNIYFKKGQFNKALNYFVVAFKQNPFSSDTCFNIALTLECLNQKIFAEKYYLKCLKLNPIDKQAQAAIKRLRQA